MKFFVFLTFILVLVSVNYGCGSTAEAPVYAPEEQRSITHMPGVSASAVSHPGYYVVTKGDTLYSIAWRYSFDYRDLATWNNISSPYTIYPGQKILLNSTTVKSMAHRPIATKQPPEKSSDRTGTAPG